MPPPRRKPKRRLDYTRDHLAALWNHDYLNIFPTDAARREAWQELRDEVVAYGLEQQAEGRPRKIAQAQEQYDGG